MASVRDKILAIAAAAALSLSVGASQSSAASLDDIKAKGSMVVATEDSYKPFEYVENGKPMGLDHDLLALLRKEAPFKIDQQIIPWTGLLAGVATGKYDVALTAAVITPDRIQSLSFTMPIAEATQYYVVRADETRIKGVPTWPARRSACSPAARPTRPWPISNPRWRRQVESSARWCSTRRCRRHIRTSPMAGSIT